ncbi:MAG: Smr/MutS family protein [Thermodesulfovibrionales bacterium]
MKKSSITLNSFKELKKYLNPISQRQGTHYSTPLSDEELFWQAMADVKEIKEFREIPLRKKKIEFWGNKKKDEVQETIEILKAIVEGHANIKLSDTGEYIEWVNRGAKGQICERLHSGDFSIQDYIDLHGMTLKEAEVEIAKFLRNALIKGLSCVKIIHGRGLRSPKGPVLKGAVENWLKGRFKKYILAYVTARDKDGGLGATYVMLNRNP